MANETVEFTRVGKHPLVKIDGKTYQFTTFKRNADGTVTFTAKPMGSKSMEMKEIDPILGQLKLNSD